MALHLADVGNLEVRTEHTIPRAYPGLEAVVMRTGVHPGKPDVAKTNFKFMLVSNFGCLPSSIFCLSKVDPCSIQPLEKAVAVLPVGAHF